tara:strand:- start:323 stop:1423 length:1101 start_codon:yes stop_codon:yes gene_type:complete
MTVIPQEKIDALLARFETIESDLANAAKLDREEYALLSREHSELSPVIDVAREFLRVNDEVMELTVLAEDESSETEMRALAREEIVAMRERLPQLENSLKALLLPSDKADSRNVIVEIRAGTGGDEAALFAADLCRMYQRYAEHQGWKFSLLNLSETGLGGVKEAACEITGKGVFSRLKFESGVHRVQRVPVTESSGRIHTSAATVAVLPEAEEIDVDIDDRDLRIDVFRASGPGGQSVNTTDSAVRVTHLPTGLIVQQQDEKSQHKNRAKAMKVLRARLYDRMRTESQEKRAAFRKTQVGTGDRSERVRTYNFPQGRVSDHRINLTIHKLEQVLEGTALNEIVDALVAEDQASRLSELENNNAES